MSDPNSEVLQPVLEARGLTKSYGHVQALRGADFTVRPGEIVALIGDNGAGKSTLVKALSGALHPDAGQILLDGTAVQLTSPLVARQCGIETVYQDLALAPDLDPAANLFLGREITRGGPVGRFFGILNKRAMREQARTSFGSLGSIVPSVDVPVGGLSGGQKQSVAVGRAATWASRVVFMDEPTAALGVVQTKKVLELIRRVADNGIAVVLVSHNMPQVLDVADRIEVLRLGRRVARFTAGQTNVEQLVAALTGGFTNEPEPAGLAADAGQRGSS
jgi:simple sugar transport system ATP-binding protein